MPLALYAIHRAPTSWYRLLGVGALALMTLAFVRTGSRGGYGGARRGKPKSARN